MTILLFVHIFGAVLFLGNIVTAAFWKVRADRTGRPETIRHAARNVMLADYVFTLPGLLMIVISGSVMAGSADGMPGAWNWLTASLILVALTGIVWLAVLLPAQRRMIRLSEQAVETGVVSGAYLRASRRWNVFGTMATLLPIIVLYVMIGKGF